MLSHKPGSHSTGRLTSRTARGFLCEPTWDEEWETVSLYSHKGVKSKWGRKGPYWKEPFQREGTFSAPEKLWQVHKRAKRTHPRTMQGWGLNPARNGKRQRKLIDVNVASNLRLQHTLWDFAKYKMQTNTKQKRVLKNYDCYKCIAPFYCKSLLIRWKNTIKAGGSTVRAQSKMSEWVSGVEWMDTP